MKKASHRGGPANTREKEVLDTEQDVLTGPQVQVSPEQVCSSETRQPLHGISTVKRRSEAGIWDPQSKSREEFSLDYSAALA